jgi:hypothetical protein
MLLYTVMFATGAYDDYSEQPLIAYLTEQEAQAEVARLIEAYSDWNVKTSSGEYNYYSNDYINSKPYKLDIDYNGPRFFTSTILFEHKGIEDFVTQTYPELFI